MTKKRIGIYLLLAFALTWGVMIPFFLLGGSYENPSTNFILTYSMLCPVIAVLITRMVTGEGLAVTGQDSLMLGLDLKNKKWIWFVLALVGPIIYLDLGELLFLGIFPQAFDPAGLDALGIPRKMLFLLPLSGIFNAVMICFGALGEEIGWRSYLYPKLEELFGTTKALLFGGIIWSVWHFPAICAGHGFGHGYFGEPWTGFLEFTLFILASGTIFYYVMKKTGSVWAAAFMHAANNALSGGTVLAMTRSEKNLTGVALQSPLRLLITGIPLIIIAIFLWRKMLREAK